jgi:thiamine biosynthesis lipoprotein ApbE
MALGDGPATIMRVKQRCGTLDGHCRWGGRWDVNIGSTLRLYGIAFEQQSAPDHNVINSPGGDLYLDHVAFRDNTAGGCRLVKAEHGTFALVDSEV